MGIMAVPGGRLLELDGLHPGGSVRKLAPEKPGSFWRPDLSFDGKRVLFCYKAHDEKSFHVYEVNADGTGLRRITSGDYDDADPMYLPDGHIRSSRPRQHHVRCGPHLLYILAAATRTEETLPVSCGNEPNGRRPSSRRPRDLALGVPTPLWRVQSLWTTNQDSTGTGLRGNQSVWRTTFRAAAHSRSRVMFSGWATTMVPGSIGIIDPALIELPDGLTRSPATSVARVRTPPVDPCEAADYHASGRFTGYKTPSSEEDFVSARTSEQVPLLMDVREPRFIYEEPSISGIRFPLRPPRSAGTATASPGPAPARTARAPARVFQPDVYEGVPGLARGSVKRLRVFQWTSRRTHVAEDVATRERPCRSSRRKA